MHSSASGEEAGEDFQIRKDFAFSWEGFRQSTLGPTAVQSWAQNVKCFDVT